MAAPFNALTVPIDPSSQAQHAVGYALTMAKGSATLHFCSVIEPGAIPSAEVMGALVNPQPIINALESDAQTVIEDAVKQAQADGVAADGSVLYGSTARAIAEFANENGSQAILICSHARSGVARLVAGSVAEDLLRTAALPVVVVHAEDDLMAAGPITVAVDGSPAASSALETAIAIALADGRSLAIMHVVESGEEWEDAAPILSAAADRVRQTKLDFELITLRGPAATTIVESAGRRGSPLIVMGTHGRGGIARLAMGSVAAAVIERAHVPVAVVRRP